MRRLYVTIFSILLSLTAIAQTVADAFYIYRNDGQFNAFFRDEVDSIIYSCYGADNVLYDEIVTQVIYTQDSIYQIPLAVIDSVSFVQPEIIFQPNVVKIAQTMLRDFLQAVDGMSLLFNPTIPHELQPEVGQVLLSTNFENSLLYNGFVGKVIKTQMTPEAFRVDCDSIYDIFDIFEQLIGIEKIEDVNTAARNNENSEWISSRNNIDFNLGCKYESKDIKASLSGVVNGTYIATITYNITRNNQYFNLKIDHDWQGGIHFNMKKDLIDSDKSLKLLTPEVSLPAIRFPAIAPIFNFHISGAPFMKYEGQFEFDVSVNLPMHSYIAQVTYNNGNFSGWNHKMPIQGDTSPNFETEFSLNGNIQTGYMVDFWVGLDPSIRGIAKDFLRFGTGLSFYIGPKITGDFSMKFGSEYPGDYYPILRDSKVGVSCLTIDYEFYGVAAIFGHRFPKATFCDGTIQTPLYHEWYVLPEFSDLSIFRDEGKKQVTICTTPTRDILIPLCVGMGLYDSKDKLLDTKYEFQNYKRENEEFQIQHTFSSLERNKEYTAKPMIKLFGREIPASPIATFKLEEEYSQQFKELKQDYTTYADDNVTVSMKAVIDTPSDQNADLSSNKNYGVYVKNNITGREDYYSVQENGSTEFYITLDIPKEKFDVDYNSFIATCDKFLFAIYTTDKEGETSRYDEQKPQIVYGKPNAVTGEQVSVEATSAVVKCKFENCSFWGATCGIEYGYDGNFIEKIVVPSDEDEQKISLAELTPNTTYHYRAFYEVNGKREYGEYLTLKTYGQPYFEITKIWQDSGLQSSSYYSFGCMIYYAVGNLLNVEERGIFIKSQNYHYMLNNKLISGTGSFSYRLNYDTSSYTETMIPFVRYSGEEEYTYFEPFTYTFRYGNNTWGQ